MTASYDLSKPIGQVRFITSDRDPQNAILQDEEYQAALDMNGGVVKLAAADALDVIANDAALVDRKIAVLGIDADGPAVAKELRVHAQRLRDQVAAAQKLEAEAAAEAEDDGEGYIGIVDNARAGYWYE
jgi:hypothetical protein